MTYDEALNFITKKLSLGILPGLDRILLLLNKMGNPQNKIKIIHIAGTNGKGTVANSVANALSNKGYKIGLFTSPWVVDYREQIQINGDFISKSDFACYVEKYQDNDCSEFEFLTAIMYKYFCDSSVDFAVVECGMGGAEDATNVEKNNAVSVITSVAVDHTAFLGNTIEEIAKNKSGIIKPNSICVLYPNNKTKNIFANTCKINNAKLVEVDDKGDYQLNNIATAQAVLDALGVYAKAEIPVIPARQEIINGILVDGAHNIDGALALKQSVINGVDNALIGMMSDKDVEGYLKIIAPLCKSIITTTPSNSRAINSHQLAKIAQKYCKNVVAVDNPQEALNELKLKNGSKLVCGSFYLARDIRNLI